MRAILSTIITSSIILAGASALAFGQASELQAAIKSKESAERVAALGYLIGTLQGISLSEERLGTKSFCLPKDFTVERVTSMVSDYIEKTKDASSAPASLAVLKALSAAYPCTEPTQKTAR